MNDTVGDYMTQQIFAEMNDDDFLEYLQERGLIWVGEKQTVEICG